MVILYSTDSLALTPLQDLIKNLSCDGVCEGAEPQHLLADIVFTLVWMAWQVRAKTREHRVDLGCQHHFL